jgi:hypothetical protein
MEKLSPEEWGLLSENAIKFSFGWDDWPPERNRVDFALVVRDSETKELCCYSTIVEMDGETAFMQHGGNFPTAKGNVKTTRGYLRMLNYLRENYKTIQTTIWNKNKAMLKLAWAGDFIIQGFNVDKHGDVLLLHEIDTTLKDKGELCGQQ